MKDSILIVEDNDDLRQSLVEFFELAGFEAECAQNGEEALRILRRPHRVELIISDLCMPVLSGYEFLRQKALDDTLCGIPVVIFSSEHDRSDLMGKGGVVATYSKSVAFLELARVASQYVAHQRK